MCSVTDASGTTDYTYDALGRVTEVEETRGALTFTTTYGYDLADNITDITRPNFKGMSLCRSVKNAGTLGRRFFALTPRPIS